MLQIGLLSPIIGSGGVSAGPTGVSASPIGVSAGPIGGAGKNDLVRWETAKSGFPGDRLLTIFVERTYFLEIPRSFGTAVFWGIQSSPMPQL